MRNLVNMSSTQGYGITRKLPKLNSPLPNYVHTE